MSPEGFWFLTMGHIEDLRMLKNVVDLETSLFPDIVMEEGMHDRKTKYSVLPSNQKCFPLPTQYIIFPNYILPRLII